MLLLPSEAPTAHGQRRWRQARWPLNAPVGRSEGQRGGVMCVGLGFAAREGHGKHVLQLGQVTGAGQSGDRTLLFQEPGQIWRRQ